MDRLTDWLLVLLIAAGMTVNGFLWTTAWLILHHRATL